MILRLYDFGGSISNAQSGTKDSTICSSSFRTDIHTISTSDLDPHSRTILTGLHFSNLLSDIWLAGLSSYLNLSRL